MRSSQPHEGPPEKAPQAEPSPTTDAERFRLLQEVAASLVPTHADALVVSCVGMPAPWLRLHDRGREARLRTLLRHPASAQRQALDVLLRAAGHEAPVHLHADEVDPSVRRALRGLEGESALAVRWSEAPLTGFVLLGRSSRNLLEGGGRMRALRTGERLASCAFREQPAEASPLGTPSVRTLFDALDEALLIVDGDGVVRLWNQAAETLLLSLRAQRVGRPFSDLEPRSVGGDPVKAARLLASEGATRRECLLRGGDGAWVPVVLSLRPLALPGPEVEEWSVVFLEPLEEGGAGPPPMELWSRPAREVILASPVPMVALDREGRVRLWTPAAERVFGWSAGEVLGGGHPLDPPGTDEPLHERLERSFREEAHVQLETDLVRRDGAGLRVVVSGTRIRDAAGRAEGALLSLVDVTHGHRLDEQIQQAQRMQAVAELAGGVAHDFNNSLTRVTGLVELALLELPEDHSVRQTLEQIAVTAMDAAGVADKLMAFSRQRLIRFEPLDLVAAVADLEATLRQTVTSDTELHLDLPTAPLVVRGDLGQVHQAVLNLVANARDAMPGGGTLRVTVRREELDGQPADLPVQAEPGSYAHLTVADTGIGMDEATRARVFEPFFSAREGGSEHETGRGLGLSTTYGIVKQMGGYIWVESKEGVGTAFHLLFLLEPGVVAPGEPSGKAEPRESLPGRGERVLVVEDDPQVLILLEQSLVHMGYRIQTARNGAEALGLLRMAETLPDLVVTDVVMPKMKGTELARRIRQDHPELPVLFITGYSSAPELRTGHLRPGQQILRKPFRQRELAAAVRGLLDQKR